MSSWQAHGFAFAEQPTGSLEWSLMSQPAEFLRHPPRIFLRFATSGQTLDFRTNVEHAKLFRTRPFLLDLVVDAELFGSDSTAMLQVDSTEHFHLVDLKDWVSDDGFNEPQHVIAMSPLFGPKVTPIMAVQLLQHHMSWHLMLGFSSYVVYCRRHFLDAYLQQAWIVKAVEKRKLKLVLWDDWSLTGDFSDQAIIFNHAMLSHWSNSDAFVMPLDVDEYFATLQPASIAIVMQQCFSMYSEVRFERWNTDTTLVTDFQSNLWSCSPSCSNLSHPLKHYCALDAAEYSPVDPQPKYTAKAQHAYSCDLHACAMQHGTILNSQAIDVKQCSLQPFIMHLYNLISHRVHPVTRGHRSCNEGWRWPLDMLHVGNDNDE